MAFSECLSFPAAGSALFVSLLTLSRTSLLCQPFTALLNQQGWVSVYPRTTRFELCQDQLAVLVVSYS